jgi:hypothetical protein
VVTRAVHLATEDELSEAVGIRLIDEWNGRLALDLRLRRGGNGYLKSRIRNFIEIARTTPLLIITDLDRLACPPELRSRWLGKLKQPRNLVLRIAVREVEAWLLADPDAIRGLFGDRASQRLPDDPDTISEPKELLLRLALYAPRAVREDVCTERGGIAGQGLGYNARLCQLVAASWDPARASSRSESLRRARTRIRELALQ